VTGGPHMQPQTDTTPIKSAWEYSKFSRWVYSADVVGEICWGAHSLFFFWLTIH